LSSAGNRTARFLLTGACDSYVPYVRCVGWSGNRALRGRAPVSSLVSILDFR